MLRIFLLVLLLSLPSIKNSFAEEDIKKSVDKIDLDNMIQWIKFGKEEMISKSKSALSDVRGQKYQMIVFSEVELRKMMEAPMNRAEEQRRSEDEEVAEDEKVDEEDKNIGFFFHLDSIIYISKDIWSFRLNNKSYSTMNNDEVVEHVLYIINVKRRDITFMIDLNDESLMSRIESGDIDKNRYSKNIWIGKYNNERRIFFKIGVNQFFDFARGKIYDGGIKEIQEEMSKLTQQQSVNLD